jgi:hypothetical protein
MPEGETKVNYQRGAAFDDSTHPNPAIRAPKPASPNGLLVLVLIIGTLIGLVLAAILGMGLYAFGWISVGGGVPAPTPIAACPPTAIFFYPECPTNEAGCFITATPSATSTPEATVVPAAATPDFPATATQVCSTWLSRFPATPCPLFVTIVP